MPLPSISSSINGISSLKKLLSRQNKGSEEVSSVEPYSSIQSNKQQHSPAPRLNPYQNRSSSTTIERVKQTGNRGADYSSINENANQKAIERSRGTLNPLVPLISHISNTLVGMDITLKGILNAVNSLKGNLDNSVGHSDLGFDTDNFRERNRRNRNRNRGRAGRASRSPRSFKGRVVRGALGGVIGAGLGWGASKLFDTDEDTSEALEIGGGLIGAGAGYLPKGGTHPIVPPASGSGAAEAAGAGGWFGRLGKFFKTGGNIIGKAAVPLTAASAVAENWDELKNTGAVDPINQGKKTLSGLGKVFDLNAPFFSLDRLEGAGDALSGATGVAYGTGTQIGKAVSDIIPPDFSDKVIDSIVGLFGGETNEDRAKKQKEIEEKQKKEWEERKKKREEEQNKISLEEENKIKEEREILLKGQLTASSFNTAGAMSDTTGVNVANLSDIGKIEENQSSPDQKQTSLSDNLKPTGSNSGDTSSLTKNSVNLTSVPEKASAVVSINQPADKPIPVVLTDDKGTPLINSADRKEGATIASKVIGTQSTPSIEIPKESVSSEQISKIEPITKSSTGVSPQVAPNVQASSDTPWLTQPKEKGVSDKAMASVGDAMSYILHQNTATSYKPQWSSGQSERTGINSPRENTVFGSTSLGMAQTQAINQDIVAQSRMPSSPSIPSTIIAPNAIQEQTTHSKPVEIKESPQSVNQQTATKGNLLPGQKSAVAYQITDEDKQFFSGDLSKLNGMNPDMIAKMKAASQEAGMKIPITSGFRSQEKQDQLRKEAIAKYGSEQAASKWVAKTSIHTTGNAADIGGADKSAAQFWKDNPKLAEAMEKQGLYRPLGHEAWHWENASATQGKNRKGLAAKLISERDAALKAETTGQSTSPVENKPSLGQVAQGAATGVAGMLAAQGVPGAASAAGVISNIQQGGKSFSSGVESAIKAASDSIGVPLSYMRTMANIESSGNASAHRTGSKYTGLYQFDEATAAGVGVQDRNNASQAAMGAAKLAQKNISSLKSYGIDVDINKNPELVYLAHQQGAKGASEIIKAAQTGQPVSDKLRKTMDANGGKGMSASQFLDHWKSTYNKKAAQVGHISEQSNGKKELNTTKSKSEPSSTLSTDNSPSQSDQITQTSQPNTGEISRVSKPEQSNTQISNIDQSDRKSDSQQEVIKSNVQPGNQYELSSGQLSRNPITENTISGMTPSSAQVSTIAPSELSSFGPRVAQNYNLLQMPNVRASIDALQSGGATALSKANQTVPGQLGLHLAAVDSLRQSGALNPMMNGDISGLINKAAPELSSSVNGIKSVFNQSLSKSIDSNGVLQNNPINTSSDIFSSSISSGLTPQLQPSFSPILETAGFNDKNSDVIATGNAAAQGALMAQVSGKRSEPVRSANERGSSLLDGQGTNLEVRNPESSIRRLTDMIISYSFG